MQIHYADVSQRGQGFTTLQMRNAPKGALYVWPNRNLEHAKARAAEIGRGDLHFAPASDLSLLGALRHRGCLYSAIVVDHAVGLEPEERRVLHELRVECVKA